MKKIKPSKKEKITDGNKKKCIIIECVGIGGVGKSFVSQQLNKELDRSVLANNVQPSIVNHFQFLLSNLNLCIFIIDTVLHLKLRKKLFYILTILLYYDKLFFCKRKNFKYIIFDQGIFQVLRSIRRQSPASQQLDNVYKNLFPHLDIIITVLADYDTIIERRRKRDNKVIIGKQYKNRSEAYKSFDESMNMTIQDINKVKEYHSLLWYKYYNNKLEPVDNLISLISTDALKI